MMANTRSARPHMNAQPSLRRRVYRILNYKQSKDLLAALVFSWVLTLMVLANVVVVILESVPSIDHQHQQLFNAFDTFSITFFTLEYLLRVWSAAEDHRPRHGSVLARRKRYMLSFHGLVDLIAIVPYFLQSLIPGLDLRILRVVRVLRILKLSHYSSALEDLIAAIYAERSSLISALYLLALSILITSSLIHYAEHHVQPDKFGTIPDAMWWSIVTLTTLGYGDTVPVTGYGKVIGALTALSGVFTLALLSGIVASAFTTRLRRQEIEFVTEVEEVLKDGQMSARDKRTIEHLRREFGITEEHAKAIIGQMLEERERYHARHKGQS